MVVTDPGYAYEPDDQMPELVTTPGESSEEELDVVEDWSAILFDEDVFPEFSIALSPEAMQALRDDPYEYVQGAIRYDGTDFSPVGIRVKGENSFLPVDTKPSLKVKFDKYADLSLLGLTELTLNNMSGDTSMMHERLAYRMYRAAGVPAARSNHALVSINGEYRGIYAHVETVDETMAARWFEDVSGSMFEVWDVDFYDQYIDKFQLEFGEDDRAPLQAVADALEEQGDDALLLAGEYLDLEQFARFFGVSGWVGQYDAYPYSNPGDDSHIYMDPTINRMVWLPHGLDETFYDQNRKPTNFVNGIVGSRCVAADFCEQDVINGLWWAQTVAEKSDLAGYAAGVMEQIESYVEDDPYRPYTANQVFNEQDDIVDWIDERADQIEDWYGAP
jgi:spore coat protein CotH